MKQTVLRAVGQALAEKIDREILGLCVCRGNQILFWKKNHFHCNKCKKRVDGGKK